MRKIKLILSIAIFFLIQGSFYNEVFGQKRVTTFTRVTQNSYSPNLYSDKINLQIFLVNLPGVNTRGSRFQGSFEIYFVPEGEIENLTLSKGGIIDEISPNDLKNKVLLNSGNFNNTALSSNRVFEKSNILFKSKISDKLRTMLGEVIVFYTIKIYDAKLGKEVYKDSSFIYSVYEGDTETARKTIYLSFFVNENGRLYTSSLPREKTITTW